MNVPLQLVEVKMDPILFKLYYLSLKMKYVLRRSFISEN
jgi:hypothetical protein